MCLNGKKIKKLTPQSLIYYTTGSIFLQVINRSDIPLWIEVQLKLNCIFLSAVFLFQRAKMKLLMLHFKKHVDIYFDEKKNDY